jgi:DNA mismatch repair protein MutS
METPVIENNYAAPIANDVFSDRETQQLIMITGPNMSGKSAILRQTALIVLLAQMGVLFPQIVSGWELSIRYSPGLVPAIIFRWENPFMVEMNETASILNNISDGVWSCWTK